MPNPSDRNDIVGLIGNTHDDQITIMHIKDGVFHALYQYVDFGVIRATRPVGLDF
jgi:hypothetical protein